MRLSKVIDKFQPEVEIEPIPNGRCSTEPARSNARLRLSTKDYELLQTKDFDQIAMAFAMARLWLSSINMDERTKVFFPKPSPFNSFRGLIDLPEKAEWKTWNRLYWKAFDKFILLDRENCEKVKQAHIKLFVKTPYYDRDKELTEMSSQSWV